MGELLIIKYQSHQPPTPPHPTPTFFSLFPGTHLKEISCFLSNSQDFLVSNLYFPSHTSTKAETHTHTLSVNI